MDLLPGSRAAARALLFACLSGSLLACEPEVRVDPIPAGTPDWVATLPAPDVLGPNEVTVEKNVGVGYENPLQAGDQPGSTDCLSFAQSFGQDAAQTEEFVKIPPDLNMLLYSLYRPATLEANRKYPVLTWGNGTCALPEGYGTLLRHVASHGFIIIAAHSRYVGAGDQPMLRGLNWVLEENKRAGSALFGKIDTARLGAFGHSQGAMATWTAAADPRIKTSVPLNGASIGSLSGSTFLITGDRDIIDTRFLYDLFDGPSAYLKFHKIPGTGALDGHLTLIQEPARVVGPVTAWFRYQLLRDPVGQRWFAGSSCTLCNQPTEWDFAAKELN